MHIFIFFELKYIKSLTVLNYQCRYGQTLLFWGKTVKFRAQVARNSMIFSNIHLCFIYFKQLLSTVKVHCFIKDVSYDAKPKTIIYLFWSEIALKKYKPRDIGSMRDYNI